MTFAQNPTYAFFRFGVVGCLTAAMYVLVLAVVAEGTGAAALGAALAYTASVGFNYAAHYVWTYRTNRPHKSSGPRYFVLVVLIFCINVSATAFFPTWFDMSYLAVQGMLAVLMVGLSFVAQTLWIFTSVD